MAVFGATGIADDNPTSPVTDVRDVRLQNQGTLTLAAIDLQGRPSVDDVISIHFRHHLVATAQTDHNGRVTIRGLRPGLHSVTTRSGQTTFRLWSEETAPPFALTNPAVVSDSVSIRGQYGGASFGGLLGTGIGIAGLVVALDAKDEADRANAEIAALKSASP